MATLEKKSPSTFNKLQHQQSLPTTTQTTSSTTVNHHHQPLQQQTSQPLIHNGKSSSPSVAVGGGSESMQVSNEQQSDNSSLYSVELEPLNIDSDPGFGSMSSSEQAQINNRQQHDQQETHQREVEELSKEVTKLKNDKLDLLRQNVVSFPRAATLLLFICMYANSQANSCQTFHFNADMSAGHQATSWTRVITSERLIRSE